MIRPLLALSLALSLSALAQSEDDAPIPYDDDSTPAEDPAVKKSKKKRRAEIREEEEAEIAGEESLASLDDPNVGVGGEFLAGAMLFESSRGGGVDPRFMYGVRFTWELGRLSSDEYLREMFFADVAWQYAATSEGTAQVRTDTNQHYFTVAPAFALPLGRSFMAAYAQLGVGFNYTYAAMHVDKSETNLSGTKLLLQYGLGLRGRPAVVGDGSVRVSFRVEVTRFLRGYMHDTFLGGGVGLIF